MRRPLWSPAAIARIRRRIVTLERDGMTKLIEPAPPTVPQIVADLLYPLVTSHDLATLLDVQAVVAKAVGESQRGITQATAASTITRVLVSWEERLRVIEDQAHALRADLDQIQLQVERGDGA